MKRIYTDEAIEEAIKEKRVNEDLLREMLFKLGIDIIGEEEE